MNTVAFLVYTEKYGKIRTVLKHGKVRTVQIFLNVDLALVQWLLYHSFKITKLLCALSLVKRCV